jgi:hypothetical protein
MRGQQAGAEQGEAVLAQALAAYQTALGSRPLADRFRRWRARLLA